jgi:hypothetical protein
LIVPVKGFDIAKGATEKKIPLKELLPPTLYPAGTIVYAAAGDDIKTYNIKDVNGNKIWTLGDSTDEDTTVAYAPRTPFWLQTNGKATNSTVFCGELLGTDVTITPDAGTMQLIGNATSTEVKISDIACDDDDDTFDSGDTIFALQAGTSDYDQYIYSTTVGKWTKTDPNSVQMQVVTDDDKLPAGAAAYFYRKAPRTPTTK